MTESSFLGNLSL